MAAGLPSKILILLIRAYKVCLSPILGQNCRFYPTCSSYSIEAIERHGFIKGLVLSIKRICRCHPFNPGGIDHVPGHETKTTESEDNE
jgi:putative membrane protein insertion efficiency factor